MFSLSYLRVGLSQNDCFFLPAFSTFLESRVYWKHHLYLWSRDNVYVHSVSFRKFSMMQIFGDPEAADIVFTSGANIDVVGINITTQVKMTGTFQSEFFWTLRFSPFLRIHVLVKDLIFFFVTCVRCWSWWTETIRRKTC